ncbi:uncharacterized protein J4E88_001290 [Alternaria novae-zelandiae]|uniref:uncharacterized protein n=1 Tax=Alternaria metachromatica TaxID=283354 RepID=UPI0020C4DAA5|nr:uncharacterized protein J4E83_002023 [Alternaria metachromatica]XP_049258824.1 uncharacterized protein J4E88_001290 [Alternaria novae-zelandiae]KAI4634703.1 hypothetical protein J4E83_002023 [Alternaria metachromatica]KAI4692920.1 hypothetical protein J4E88_001290 [Alternaria novae-zelandiae]
MTAEAQKLLLKEWAKDTDHLVDDNNSPKAEFARLAKAKGWTGGDTEWYKSTTADTTVHKNVTAQAGGIDLTDRMRSLSIGSDTSSFSVISRTSANSFESVRSINSDQSHEAEGFSTSPKHPPNTEVSDSTDLQNSVLSLDTVKSLEEISGGVEIPDTASEHSDAESEASSLELDENPAWSEYTNFVHRPDASFQSEFERLARTKGWVGRIKRQHLVELLTSEVEFYWGADDVDKLEYYQFLCQEMGVKQIPLTITQAKNALRPLKVNLYSVIDHMRNPEIKVITYKTIRELRQSVRKKGTFPRQCAKAGEGCMAALLSKL